jgi:hypothetical protein
VSTADKFRKAVEADDHDAITATFAPDIRLFSPVKFVPFEGIETVSAVFSVLQRTFEDFRYVGEFSGQAEEGDSGDEVGSHILIFRTLVGGKQVHGMDLLQFDAEGRISTFTVMVRPMSALNALNEAIYAGLIADGVVPAP